MRNEDSRADKSRTPDSELKREGLKDRLIARTRREKALRRRKLLRLAVIVAAAITVFLLLYPHLQVMWYMSRANSDDSDARKYALQWLAERRVKKAVPVFIKALEGTRGESEYAMETLRTLAGNEIIPALISIWESKESSVYAKHNALQLIAEKGDKSHAPIFVDTRVLLHSRMWDSAWDFLRKNADSSTVEMIVSMLSSSDVLKRRAAAIALRPIKEMDIVKNDDPTLDALAKAVTDSDYGVRLEALRTISGIARHKDFEAIESILAKDEDPGVRTYAADVLGELRDPRAIPVLVRSLKDSEGSVCLASTDALIKIGNYECEGLLSAIILDEKEDALARVQAVVILRRIRAPGAAQVLASALGSSERRVAMEAAKSLARVGTSESVGALAHATESTISELRMWSAHALGLIGDPAGEGALLVLLKDSDLPVVRTAVQSLLVIGDASTARKAAQVFEEVSPESQNRKEIASLLAGYRTPKSISILINSALSAYPGLREEARLELNSIGQDILSSVTKEESYAAEMLLQSAQRMSDEVAGSQLAAAIKSISVQARGEIGAVTGAVLKTIRELQEENKPDRDALREVLINARTFHWTAMLVESLKASGISQEKMISAAEKLVAVTADGEAFKKFPSEETVSAMGKIVKELKLSGTQD